MVGKGIEPESPCKGPEMHGESEMPAGVDGCLCHTCARECYDYCLCKYCMIKHHCRCMRRRACS